MSEADNAWRVTLGGTEYQIEVDYSTMTGKIVVKVDGAEVGDDRLVFKDKQVDFPLGGSRGVVEVSNAYGGFAAKSQLHIDGRYVEPLRR